MTQTLLSAAWRVETMIGRRDELNKIKQSIYGDPEDRCCRVVLLTGDGGIGKSRLLEEVQWRAGHPQTRENARRSTAQPQQSQDDWSLLGSATVSDVIDLIDIRLSARTQLLQAIRNALSYPGGVDFSGYENAMRTYLRDVENSAGFAIIESHAKEAEDAFWQAFKEHAATHRIVLLLDTAERMVLRSSDWLIDKKLLTPSEMMISSQEWLLGQLGEGRLINTTLIFAGRDGELEGGKLFNRIRSILHDARTPCKGVEVVLGPLSEEETVEYFQFMAREWQERAGPLNGSMDREAGEFSRISRSMNAMAQDIDRLQVLYLVSGGRPVLLSLYGDLIHEKGDIPEALQLTSGQILQALEDRGQRSVQHDIERSFIDLLFQQPGLRSKLMRALARCPAGLSPRQLHFVLDSEPDADPSSWEPDILRLREIRRQLEQIGLLSIARPRPDDPLGLPDVIQHRAASEDKRRMGLQDEIYRIYAERMDETEDLRSYEREERVIQYKKLSRWADWGLRQLRTTLRAFQAEDERRLIAAIQLPTKAVRPYIPSPLPSEQEQRSQIQQAIRDWEQEKLHYDLLGDVARALNDDYTDLAERRWLTNNEEADFVAQQEMWRVLHDPYALKFLELSGDELKVLKRMALEEDPARWIKRFILRRDFHRAIKFHETVETVIDREPESDRASWQHPLNAGERRIWRDYAQIMLGEKVTEAVESLKRGLKVMVDLTRYSTDELVESAGVTGFRGHDGLTRLYRVIGVGYNFAGYGHVVLGQYRQAVEGYGQALTFIRKTKFEARHAVTLNNLGRALASLGREERGYRVCADGLDLRRGLGAEIPIAYSLNTLALIGNGFQRTPTAWREATQAAAMFRRAPDNRGLGLALIQLAIGLRRLANSREPGVILEASPEELYATAQDALSEAIDIFEKDEEVLRRIEARLEFGCILRDQMRLPDIERAPQRLIRLYRDAENELTRAIQLAQAHDLTYLAVQAHVDLAWTHFFAKNYGTAQAAGEEAERRIPDAYQIKPDKDPDPAADEAHYFYQLAKLQGLYAGIAMEDFKKRREGLRKEYKVSGEMLSQRIREDEDAKTFLRKSAEGYVLSLYYGQMFSPRSRSLAITFDQIYEHVKGFNLTEYSMFYEYQREAAHKYDISDKWATSETGRARPYDFSYLENWLNDCFGRLDTEAQDERPE